MQWKDIDLDAKVWSVTRNLTMHGYGSLKTKRSRRDIDLDDGTIAIMVAWIQRQADELEPAGIEPSDDLAVWTRPGTDIPIHVDRYTANHLRLVKEAGLAPMKLHGVRALHGSFLIEADVPLHVVSRRLGHSSDSFTSQIYIRQLDGQVRVRPMGFPRRWVHDCERLGSLTTQTSPCELFDADEAPGRNAGISSFRLPGNVEGVR